VILYNLAIKLFRAGVGIASVWKPKARSWIEGRKNLFPHLQQHIRPGDQTIWFHCASAGELEQGKSLIEAVNSSFPSYKIVLTFFSPSGYEAGKNYKYADVVCYLPLDTASNAKHFIDLINPKLVVFIKYEYWFHHLNEVAKRKVPLLLVSAIFREKQPFFHPWGSFYRRVLRLFSWIFVQDENSLHLLKTIGINNSSVAGDTRFDRVLKIRNHAEPVDRIQDFVGEQPTLVAGSTWPEDEIMLLALSDKLKLIVVPHEITEKHIADLKKQTTGKSILYSDLLKTHGPVASPVLIIDNFGMLSRLYQYGIITYIGGGFNKSGIHNTLEAAAWGKPVIFGPNYKKFREARELIAEGAGFTISDTEELSAAVNLLLADRKRTTDLSIIARQYVEKNAGATRIIIDHIQRNLLLTTS
jgi:3-deoxy-D-manno-octulosonic-acid transferase